jgi:hypothetical protein
VTDEKMQEETTLGLVSADGHDDAWLADEVVQTLGRPRMDPEDGGDDEEDEEEEIASP